MRIYPEKLAQDLKQQLRPVYLVSGEEVLLVQEIADRIRAAARQGGCSERTVIDADDRAFAWENLNEDANSMSLFAERKLLELRIPSGKPGSEGSKALCSYVENLSEDNVLLIVAGKIDKASTNSKWYRAIDGCGATVQLWPVKAQELPRWLEQRARSIDLQVDREALQILADRVEGNLLAAVQELEKLRLIADGKPVGAAQVADAVANSARFNTYGMLDTALAGRSAESLRMVQGLRAEGAHPVPLVAAISREVKQLQTLLQSMAQGQSAAGAMAQARVWKTREAIVRAALSRHSLASADTLLLLAGNIDGAVKGYAQGDPWELLESLILGLAGSGEASMPLPMAVRGITT